MKKRITIFKSCLIIFFTIIIIRLFFVQIWNHEKNKMIAEKNTSLNIRKIPIRATIKDRNGKILAKSFQTFKITFNAKKEEIIYIKKILEKNNYKNLKLETKKIQIKNLKWEELQQIFNLNEIPMPEIETEQERKYYSIASSHIIGYIQKINEKDEGKTGIEKGYNKDLEGVQGKEIFLINSKRNKIKKNKSIKPEQAKDLTLSIDENLQQFAYNSLIEHKKGAVIVVDIKTGEILCAVSYPAFDPNDFVTKDAKKLKNYFTNENTPTFNLFLNGIYPTGSSTKPFMLLAALNKNLPKTFYCQGKYQMGKKTFHCSHNHGTIPLDKILPYSCNIAFYTLSEYVNRKDIEKVWQEFGLGEPVLPEITRTYGKLSNKKPWKRLDTLFMQIGQVHSITSLAQLTRAFARLASFEKTELTILKQNNQEVLKKLEPLNYPKEHLLFIRKGMFESVNDPRGTSFLGVKNDIAGKTGTAQVKSMKSHEYRKSNRLREWKYKDHSIFCAFAPYSDPKIAACMIIEHGGASYHAVPVLIRIIKETLKTVYENTPKNNIINEIKNYN